MLAHQQKRIQMWKWSTYTVVLDCVWNVMTHAWKPDLVFRRNGRVRLNRQGGRQFSRLLAAEVRASATVMLDTPRSEVVWRVLATHSIRQFPLHFPSRASPWAIRFQNALYKPGTCAPSVPSSTAVEWTSFKRWSCVKFYHLWNNNKYT